jgi:hypothetical protein
MRIRKPSPAMVVACIALFIALSGASYAAFTLPDNSVRSRHIVNGQVKRADLDGGAVNSAKVANGSLTPGDLAAGVLPRGRFNAGGSCDPSSIGSDLTCATITMNLPRAARMLLVVSGSWHEQGTADGSVLGHCFLYADTTAVWSASYGQKTATFEPNGAGSPYNGTVSETYVTDVISAGSHTFRVDCRENEADITFVTGLSAVTLSSS